MLIFLSVNIYGVDFPGGSAVKNIPPMQSQDSVSGLGNSPGERNGKPLQYSCLGNPMDRGAWWATVRGAAKELDTTERLNHHHHGITELLYIQPETDHGFEKQEISAQ